MYTFGSNSDDGFRLTIEGQRFEGAFGQGATVVNTGGGVNSNGSSSSLPARWRNTIARHDLPGGRRLQNSDAELGRRRGSKRRALRFTWY
jgi:hypothetical protein